MVPPPTNGYIETAAISAAGTGRVYRKLTANWYAPPKPISYRSGNIIFLFPGLSNNQTSGEPTILQPVLQLGNNGLKSPGNSWIGALYVCQGPGGLCYVSSGSLAVAPGQQLTGVVYATNCSAGKCDWTVQMINSGTLTMLSMTLAAGTMTNGQTNDDFTLAHGGAMEAYNLTKCDEFPAGGIGFFNIGVQTDMGPVTSPAWLYNHGIGVIPRCGYGVTTTSTSVTLGDSATTSIRAVIGGPSSAMEGASGTWIASISAPHTGTAPYSFSWGGILGGTGPSVSGVPRGSGHLRLRITDAAGVYYDTSVFVSVCPPNVSIC